MAGSLYQGKYFMISHVVAIAFTKSRNALRICLYFTFQTENNHWMLRAKFYPYNSVQGSHWKDQLLHTDVSEQKLVYKKSRTTAERASNPSMLCGFMRNHQAKYASAGCLVKARATKHVLSEGFRNWWWVNTEEESRKQTNKQTHFLLQLRWAISLQCTTWAVQGGKTAKLATSSLTQPWIETCHKPNRSSLVAMVANQNFIFKGLRQLYI